MAFTLSRHETENCFNTQFRCSDFASKCLAVRMSSDDAFAFGSLDGNSRWRNIKCVRELVHILRTFSF